MSDPRRRAGKLHDWLFEDPLCDFGPQCLQILAATYSAFKDYRSTALYGLVSIRATPEDAMTLNGVAFAMAEGNFQLERGLLLANRAVSILRNPIRLNKPPRLSESRWQRELKHALAASLDTKGCLLTRLKRWDEARAAFEEALKLEKSDEIYYHFGLMLKEKGDLNEAVRMLREGLKFTGPKRTEIQMALEELEK
jgi:tetratricopeptide (TPR) repeat protein